jgi:hypothetical protein
VRPHAKSFFVVILLSSAGFADTPQNRIGHPKDPSRLTGAEKVGLYPDRKKTPGTIDPTVTKSDICTASTKTRRHVLESVKKKVFLSYGIDYAQMRAQEKARGEPIYEVDHLVSLELGGSNDIKNLWPEPFQHRIAGAADKDKVENRLRSLICKGKMSLADAQRTIRSDWYRYYWVNLVPALGAAGGITATPAFPPGAGTHSAAPAGAGTATP